MRRARPGVSSGSAPALAWSLWAPTVRMTSTDTSAANGPANASVSTRGSRGATARPRPETSSIMSSAVSCCLRCDRTGGHTSTAPATGGRGSGTGESLGRRRPILACSASPSSVTWPATWVAVEHARTCTTPSPVRWEVRRNPPRAYRDRPHRSAARPVERTAWARSRSEEHLRAAVPAMPPDRCENARRASGDRLRGAAACLR